MGCICSKGGRANNFSDNNVRRKENNKPAKRLVSLSRKDEVVVEVDGSANDATASLISNQPGNDNVEYAPVSSDEGEKKEMIEKANNRMSSSIVSMSNGERGAQVVAGWPSWLTSVAGEAINGWVPRRADSFEKLDKIGQGTYSSVYKARDLETNKIVALKKVRFANMDPESVRFMAREIIVLRRLDHPNVMKLEGVIASRMSGSLYLVFEYMEHDLAGLLASPAIKFTEAQIKCYMQQLLHGLEHCHNRGVLHRDIKGSNLLIDTNGNLKIADFGLATFFSSPQKQPLTSRVVTLWYRPPELLLGATDYGVAVDLWSAGCILAELFAGKPIMPGRTEVEQLHKIFKLCGSPSDEYWKRSKLPHATIFKPQHPYKRCVAETYKDFPSSALSLLDVLLAVEPEPRGTAFSALDSEFFKTKPLPCDPSSLPKYPPTKEFDVKFRDEDARRRRAVGGKGRGHESTRRSSKESKAVPAPDANAELQASIQKRQGQSNQISISEQYNQEEDGGSGYPIGHAKGTATNVYSHSGQSMHPTNFGSSRNMNINDAVLRAPGQDFISPRQTAELSAQRSFVQREAVLSRFSNSVAVRGDSHFQGCSSTNVNSHWPEESFNARYNNLDDSSHSLLGGPNFSHKKPGLESKMGYSAKKGRVHYSGPLVPQGGNIEEMLKEHERQIQRAMRKACLEKNNNESGQSQSLLYHQRINGQ
ncbi:PREDICTED: probable serine/threonine-protein kinase At1g09600 isoform X1 [Populus euphratica]|uniref:Probable serine/threonine-protein kinase At1g09600 isoform X1 n=1 Tax=Populus euphratica TaxID=75702 RepID=A0AAJ6UFC5_POPEU|nr:PREDICTED: probable serine/threonine-protein kinase At1g09600 isoform X1 [Populus euphratica]